MSDRTAATALRLLAPRAFVLGTGDPDSLQNVNTTELPNGSLCWVNENSTLYRLNKTSSAASAPTSIIVPGSGPGRWFALSGDAVMSNARMSMFSPEEPTFETDTQDVWQVLPPAEDLSTRYFPQVNGAAFWSIHPQTGVATYSGPNMIYHFTAVMSIAVDAEATTTVQMALTVDGEDIGTNSARDLAERCVPFDADHFQIVSIANEVELATGDTVQLILRNTTGEDNLILSGIQMIGIPVGVVALIT